MIILITGTPGSGKTLYCMDLLRGRDFEGRAVYSNIPGTDHLPIPDNDWRKTPDGSVVVYDEAQQFFPSTGRAGQSSDAIVAAMDTHRHTGHDLIIITQRYALVHVHLRAFVGQHVHLVKRSSGLSTVYARGEVFDPADRRKLSDVTSTVWRHPKDLFAQYDSASIHTAAQTRRKIPGKIKILGVVLALIFGAVIYFVFVRGLSFLDPDKASEVFVVETSRAEQSGISTGLSLLDAPDHSSGPYLPPPAPREQDWLRVPDHSISVSGCVASAHDCRCYDSEGAVLLWSDSICRAQLSRPARSIRVNASSVQSPPPPAESLTYPQAPSGANLSISDQQRLRAGLPVDSRIPR